MECRARRTEAYQCGKAANIAPAAVISQTSLPSQTGPIELSRTRLLRSLRLRNGIIMPTPRSKPSRNRYPIQSTTMRTNQIVARISIVTFPQYANDRTSSPLSVIVGLVFVWSSSGIAEATPPLTYFVINRSSTTMRIP